MEPWQTEYVVKEMSNLIDVTVCNQCLLTELQSVDVLTLQDIQILVAIRKSDGEMELLHHLYNVIQSREKSYEKVTRSLYQCKQTGPLKIFLEGFRLQGIDNPLERCNIPINYENILATEAYFSGHHGRLQTVFKKLNVDILKAALKSTPIEHDFSDIFLVDDKKFIIAESSIPAIPELYIPRFISNRVKCNPAIFKHNSPDIFVFKGIQRTHLSRLAAPSSISTSSLQKLGLTSRFILLEDEADWSEIRSLARKQSLPAHLIKCENVTTNTQHGNQPQMVTFILECTVGQSIIRQKLSRTSSSLQTVSISEYEFIQNLEEGNRSTGICFCDTPGMGKSWLLANLARNMQQQHPERIVAFIPFTSFIKQIGGSMKNTQMNCKIALELAVRYISPTGLGRAILFQVINDNMTQLELFFDGMDEVSRDDMTWTKEFLQFLTYGKSNIKVFVASRPQLRMELESTLGFNAYDILPFTEENQKQFLVKSWKKINANSIQGKLEKFALACLANIKETVTQKEQDILGIPLQCFLLSQVYEKEAGIFSNPRRNQKTVHLKSITVYEMYKIFLEMRFQCHVEADKADGKSDVNIRSEIAQMKQLHLFKALQLLFPDLAEAYSVNNRVSLDDPTNKHLSYGILEQRLNSSTEDFIHRSMAEFLVAEYFAELLLRQTIGKPQHLEANKDVFQYILTEFFGNVDKDFVSYSMSQTYCIDFFKFQNNVMAYFLDNGFKRVNTIPDSSVIATAFGTSLTPAIAYRIFQACASQCFLYIFRYVEGVLCSLSKPLIDSHKEYFLTKRFKFALNLDDLIEPATLLLCTASHFASTTMVKEILQLFQNCFKYDISTLCFNMPISHITPLHPALMKADYEVVELLYEKFYLEQRSLLYWCIQDSYGESSDIVSRRINICKLLLGKRPNLIKEEDIRSWKFRGPLVAERIHLDIIKFLVKEGADLYATRDKKDTCLAVAHCAMEVMSNSDFMETCQFLVEKCKTKDIFKIKNQIMFPLLQTAKTTHVDGASPGINFQAQTKTGNDFNNNLVLSAIRQHYSIDVIRHLVENGEDYKFKNVQGKTSLHLAASLGNLDMVKYLISLGLPLESCDNKGRTPIYSAAKYFEILKYLLTIGSNILVVDINGNTIAHKLRPYLHSINDFRVLYELFIRSDPSGKIFRMKNTHGRIPIQEYLLSNDVAMDIQTLDFLFTISLAKVNDVDERGDNLLLSAIKGGKSIEILERIAQHGVNYRSQNLEGKTIIHLLAEKATAQTLDHFLSLEPNLNCRDNMGRTPLHYAVGNMETLRKLVSSGADLNAVDNCKNSIAHVAAMNCRETEFHQLITFLIETGNETIFLRLNEDGRTPILTRLIAGLDTKKFTFDLLLTVSGNDVSTVDTKGDNGVLLAIQGKQNITVLETLIQGGSDFTVLNTQGQDSLQLAAEAIQPDTLRYLLALDNGKHLNRKKALESTTRALKSLKVDTRSELKKGVKLLEMYFNLTQDLADIERLTIRNSREDNQADKQRNGKDMDSINSGLRKREVGLMFEKLSKLSREDNFQELLVELCRNYSAYNLETCLQDGCYELVNDSSHGYVTFVETTKDTSWQISSNQFSDSALNGVKLLKTLMHLGVNVAEQGPDGYTLLHQVPKAFNADQYHQLVEFLFQNGYGEAFHILNDAGVTPFHFAIYDLELLSCTLDIISGVQNAKGDKTVETVINPTYSDLKAIDVTEGNSLIHWAIQGRRSVGFLKNMIKLSSYFGKIKNINLNACLDMTKTYCQGNTFLHLLPGYVTPDQYHEMVEFLVAKNLGEIFSAANSGGLIPLHTAACHMEILPETLNLLSGKFDPSVYAYQGRNHVCSLLNFETVDEKGNSILHWTAAGKGSLAFLKQLVSLCLDQYLGKPTGGKEGKSNALLKRNLNGDTFAHNISGKYSAEEYHEMVKFLIESGLGKIFLESNNSGVTPFLGAVYHQEVLTKTLDLLVGSFPLVSNNERIAEPNTMYIDMNAVDINGHSILHIVLIRKRNFQFVEHLLTTGLDLLVFNKDNKFVHTLDIMKMDAHGNTFAHYLPQFVTAEQYHTIAELLIEKRMGMVFQVINIHGRTPLHEAVYHLQILPKTMELLTGHIPTSGNESEKGESEFIYLDLAAVDKNQNSIIHLATYGKRSFEFLHQLIHTVWENPLSEYRTKRMTILTQNVHGNTFAHILPLYYSATEFHNISELLIRNDLGDIFRTRNKHGRTPVFEAIYRLEMLPKTLELLCGACCIDWVEMDLNGNTLLLIAVTGKRSLHLVKYMINLGADHAAQNNHGNNVLHISAANALIGHLTYFVSVCSNIDSKDSDGDTPLHCAADGTDNVFEICKLLIDLGADKLLVNNEGKTAYDIAVDNEIEDERILHLLHAASFNEKEIFPSQVENGKCGLLNPGNMCYVNSIVQCLASTQQIVCYLREVLRLNDLRHLQHQKMREVTTQLALVVQRMENEKTLSLFGLKKIVGSYNPRFLSTDQQDSHEFLTVILSFLIQEEINSTQAILPVDENGENFKLSDMFCGQYISRVTCKKCRQSFEKIEPFLTLSLPIPHQIETINLLDCLKQYKFEEEILDWNCSTCDAKVTALKTMDLYKLPQYLVIHLSRFLFDGNWTKNINEIDFPVDRLNLTTHSSDLDDDCNATNIHQYQLYAVSNHYGSMKEGHFTAFCRDKPNGCWWKLDDNQIRKIDEETVSTSAAYILFYERCP